MKKTVLRAYARLIAKMGVNVQKGQEVFVFAELDQPEFVKMVVEECYKLGAKKVVVDWSYQPLTKVHNRCRSLKVLSQLDDYEEARWKHFAENFPCRIYLESEDPDGLKGLNTEKIAKSMQARGPIIKKYRDVIEGRHQWCIAAVPGRAWAKKLFPNCTARQAEEKLWQAILTTSRADSDPIAQWEAHNADLHARCNALNALNIKSLRYRASNGTDFTVGMIKEARFMAGEETTVGGIAFNPNIPSEECFISPMKGVAQGTVVSTMPLSYNGQLIENFSIRFENGKAVEWHAEKNEDLLDSIITMDEGSAFLGECALVPQASPIAQSGILFFNTLFDENASCHLALGAGFPDTIEGYQNKTLQECQALGINDSIMHVDFMIGCDDMSIDAETENGTVAIFRNGNWAF